jgi:hypothetical protein
MKGMKHAVANCDADDSIKIPVEISSGFLMVSRIFSSSKIAKLVTLKVKKPHTRDSHRHLTQRTVATSERQFADPLYNVPTAEIIFLSTPQDALADERRD